MLSTTHTPCLRCLSRLRPLAILLALAACGGDKTIPSPDAPPAGSSSGSAVASSSSSTSSTSSSSSSSTSSSSGGACTSGSTANGYCLIWSDEFEADSLDTSKWSIEANCYGGGNNEAQCYTRSSENVWLEDGLLYIRALREDVRGPAAGDDSPDHDPADTSGSGTFSSGRIRTLGKGDWRYGRFEIRAKLPRGQGAWPAIWMLPSAWVYGGWASSGEIDIVEAVNLGVEGERRVHGTLHFGDNWPNNVYSGEAYLLPDEASPADDFHVYALEWEEGEIRWFVDDLHYATQTQDGWYSAAALSDPSAPFNQDFHLILNLAVGGDWAANTNATGIDDSAFPQALVVDYVRVYQCGADSQTGRGCGKVGPEHILNPGVLPPGNGRG